MIHQQRDGEVAPDAPMTITTECPICGDDVVLELVMETESDDAGYAIASYPIVDRVVKQACGCDFTRPLFDVWAEWLGSDTWVGEEYTRQRGPEPDNDDEIAPDAPDLRAAAEAVLADWDRVTHDPEYQPSGFGDYPPIDSDLLDALRAAYDATPEPAPAITAEEQETIGLALEAIKTEGHYRVTLHSSRATELEREEAFAWMDAAWKAFTPDHYAVLARLAGRT